jgi:uncharacterized protein
MSVELRPLGVSCNIGCRYCYQAPMREAGNLRQKYDLEKMKEAVRQAGRPFTLFGGEPLLLNLRDLEHLLEWGYKEYGYSQLQTNGSLVTAKHLELFRRYRVRLGISIDGPGELNDARWAHSATKTRATTERVEQLIEQLAADPVLRPGLIVTLHRGNATGDKLPRMNDWFRHLDRLGIRSVRLHLLEVDADAVREGYALSPRENVEALLNFVELESELERIEFDVVGEIEQLLLGDDDRVSCVWRACDPYTTEAVRGVEGNGQSSNCGRTNKDGVDFTKADEQGFERGVALYHTPQEHGGCQGCRFFLMCKGQCPGTAIDGDWRNRTEHCRVWMTLFTHVERKLLTRGETPLTLSTARKGLERRLVAEWRSGRNPQIGSLRPKDVEPAWQAQRGPAPALGGVRYLDFSMHAFRRCSWVSDTARSLWEERLHRVEKTLATLAILGVADGLRPCAMIEVRPEQTFAFGQLAAAHDLAVAVLQRGQGRRWHPPQPGMPARAPLPEGVPALDVLAVGTPRQVGDLHQLHRRGLFDELEQVLGYPSECRSFASRVYDGMGLRDPIWPMALATLSASREDGSASLRIPCAPHSNFLLAAIGLAPTPFQPTSFDCPHAAAFFDKLLVFGRDRGFAVEMEWLAEILSWPVQWSALHGIAETKTPVVKISSDTDATADKLTLTYLGSAEVAMAAQGLGFPYQTVRRRGVKVVNG